MSRVSPQWLKEKVRNPIGADFRDLAKYDRKQQYCINGCKIAHENPNIVCAYSTLISLHTRKQKRSLYSMSSLKLMNCHPDLGSIVVMISESGQKSSVMAVRTTQHGDKLLEVADLVT